MTEQRPPIASNVETVVLAVQNTISLAVGFIAFLTAGGFIVVNSYLARFTDIHGYNIDPRRYLTAGIGLLIPPLLALAVVFLAYYFGRFLGIMLRARRYTRPPLEKPAPKNFVSRNLQASVQNFDSLIQKPVFKRLMFIVAISLYTLLFGLLYGTYIYGSVPYDLGGGRPVTAILVFQDQNTLQSLGFANDFDSANRTGTVLLLADLSDGGLLVADTTTGRVVAVKQDALIGILDDRVETTLMTPIPALPITPVPTPGT